jgi:hypothetical protein
MTTSTHVHRLIKSFEGMAVVPAIRTKQQTQPTLRDMSDTAQHMDMTESTYQAELNRDKSLLPNIFDMIIADDSDKISQGLLQLNLMTDKWFRQSTGAMLEITTVVAHTPAVMRRVMHLLAHNSGERARVTDLLLNVTVGDEDDVAHVMLWGILPTLFTNMRVWDPSLLKNILWIIANIVGTSTWHRDRVLEFDPWSIVLNVCSSSSYELKVRRVAAWLLTQLCRGHPYRVLPPVIVSQILTSVFHLVSSGDLPPTPAENPDHHCVFSGIWTLVYLTDELKSKHVDVQQTLLHPYAMTTETILQMALRCLRDLPTHSIPLQRPLLRIIWNVTGGQQVQGIPSNLIVTYQNIHNWQI